MANRNKQRAYEQETEVRDLARENGLDAIRCWGSDGRSRGLPEGVDVVLEEGTDHEEWLQCKRRKNIANYLDPGNYVEGVNIVVVREDYNQNLFILTEDKFLKIYKKAYDNGD